MRQINLKYAFLHVFLPLFIGTFIYWIFTPKNSVIAHFFSFFEKIEGLENFRHSLQESYSFPNFIAFQLPDALWAYAFCALFVWIWKKEKAAFASLLAFVLCSFYEFSQFFNWLDGTFDWWDIFALFAGCLSAYTINRS